MEDEVVIATNIKTGADKAKAASELGKKIIEKGLTRGQASKFATEELKHALADKSTLKEGNQGPWV